MDIGFIGLGKMGGNMVERIHRDSDHRVVAYDRSPDAVQAAVGHGATGVDSLQALVSAMTGSPKAIWLMVPAGDPVQATIEALIPMLSPGDILIDGGNSNFHDTQRRAAQLKEHGMHFVDAGTSGGVWGLKVGYCQMIGADPEAFAHVEPIFKVLAPPDGYLHVGPPGAGHFVKMVHNGIEYGLMQAYAEGFEILHASTKMGFDFDLHRISHLWNQGSVVRSWLLELAELAFEQEGNDVAAIKGFVNDSGEGRWTIQAAIDLDVPAPVITLSLYQRFVSRQGESYAAKVLAALRNQFGGHAVKREG